MFKTQIIRGIHYLTRGKSSRARTKTNSSLPPCVNKFDFINIILYNNNIINLLRIKD
jgi:hypothetical protein